MGAIYADVPVDASQLDSLGHPIHDLVARGREVSEDWLSGRLGERHCGERHNERSVWLRFWEWEIGIVVLKERAEEVS